MRPAPTPSATDLSGFARTLIDDADAAARTTLGLGTAATLDVGDIGGAADVAALYQRDAEEVTADPGTPAQTIASLDGYRGVLLSFTGEVSYPVTIGAGIGDRVFYVRASADNPFQSAIKRGTTVGPDIGPGQMVWCRVSGSDANALETWTGSALSQGYNELSEETIDGDETVRVLGGLGYAVTSTGQIAQLAIDYTDSVIGGMFADAEGTRSALGLEIGLDVQAHASRLDLLSAAPVPLTDGATIATDASLSTTFAVTLGGNRTLAAPSNGVAGLSCKWVIHQDGTGGRTLAFDSAFRFPGGTDPALSTAPGAVDVLVCLYDGTRWLCDLGGKGFA